MQLTTKSKNIIKIFVALILVSGVFFAWKGGYFDNTKVTESTTVGTIDLPSAQMADNTNLKVTEIPLPTKQATAIKAPTWRMGQMQWESQLAIHLANGGVMTTKNSLFEKAGIRMNITRQDMCMTGIAEIVKCAENYKKDKNTSEGYHFYNVMFDGSGGFIKNLETQLAPLGADYRPVIIPYFPGKSYGADAIWIPRTWVETNSDGGFTIIKDSLKGSLCATVAKDGDWNLLCNLSSITQIPMNWNIGTYDENAINVHNISDFQLAAECVIPNGGKGIEVEMTRKRGSGVGGKITKNVQFISSWSPEDQQLAEEVGGFVRILSTKEYDSQMPCAMITFKKFVDDNRESVVNMILAMSQASDQIKSFRPSLKHAATIAAEVYQNKDASYFMAMYLGDQMTDAQNEKVEVGGNRVMNLADNMEMWGLADGSINVAAKVYKTYADIIAKNYPEDMPGGPVAFSKVVDISILQEAYEKSQTADFTSGNTFITKAELPDFSKEKTSGNVMGNANYQINFATNSAEFLPGTEETLNQILNQSLSGSNTRLQINGHTDSDGDETLNRDLSRRRAEAVSNWLKKQAPSRFTGYRVKVDGFGESAPIASNNTAEGKSKNRRVEVIVVSN